MSYLKTSLEEKQGEVNNKDNALQSLRKEIENLKTKIVEQNKAKLLEREEHEKEISRIKAEIEKNNIENITILKRELAAKE